MSLEHKAPISEAVRKELLGSKPAVEQVSTAVAPQDRVFQPELATPESHALPEELSQVTVEVPETYLVAQSYGCERTSNGITNDYPSPLPSDQLGYGKARYNGFWSSFLNAQIENGFCLNHSTVRGLAQLFVAFNGNTGDISRFTNDAQLGVNNSGQIIINRAPQGIYQSNGGYYVNGYNSAVTNSYLDLNIGRRSSLTIGGTTIRPNGSSSTIRLHFNFGGRRGRH